MGTSNALLRVDWRCAGVVVVSLETLLLSLLLLLSAAAAEDVISEVVVEADCAVMLLCVKFVNTRYALLSA